MDKINYPAYQWITIGNKRWLFEMGSDKTKYCMWRIDNVKDNLVGDRQSSHNPWKKLG